MKVKRKATIKIITICFVALLAFSFTNNGDGEGKRVYKTTEKAGEAYRMFINNIDMPMNREGVMGDVAFGGAAGGFLDGKVFLFSGGFYMSGVTNGSMWANAVMSASRTQDYEAGNYEFGKNDARAQLYVLRQKEGDFAPSWEEWKDAVALGAYFYDGDGDGQYNPVDLNGNGKWDRESSPGAADGEDRPDLLGDETVWCVYHDNVDPALRRFNNIDPQGIEIRQTVFALASKGVTGNMIFIRYSIVNSGLKADVIDSVYFGLCADADLGNLNDAYFDDLVGSDTTLNAGFTYNNGEDNEWGVNPPCFMIDFFQGPVSYVPGETFIDNNGDGEYTEVIDTPLDTAFNVQGQARGIGVYPGARNLGLSSFMHYMQSHPTVGDPDFAYQARNYNLGLDKNGNPLDPCVWTYGNVRGGVNCAEVNNKFWYSGDPVANGGNGVGWINIFETDQRQMSNTGPFQLVKDKPVDIVVAYVVGRGTDALNSVTVAKSYDLTAQVIFDNNFPSPPAPPAVQPTVQNGSNFFDINWETYEQIPYNAVDTVLGIDRRFQGYYVTAYKTNSKAGTVNGIQNSKIIAEYEVDNFIKSVYQAAANGGQDLIYEEVDPQFKLDSVLYSDPASGRIRLKIYSDPFTGAPLIKGHEYYFAITHYYLNHEVVVNRETGTYGPEGDYLDPSGGAIEEFETPIEIVTFGEDQYNPALTNESANHSGASDGEVQALIVNTDQLTGDSYTVEFFKDSLLAAGEDYSIFWRLINDRTDAILIDSSKTYDFDTTKYSGEVTEGFILKVKPIEATIDLENVTYEPDTNIWYTTFRTDSSTGVYYVGRDISQGSAVQVGANSIARSNFIRADRIRKVELRFGDPGKAYRYLNGFIGTNIITRRGTFVYAEAVTPADTLNGRGTVGNWDTQNDRAIGWVDVPFTAWVVDDVYGEERQLAVGFIEISKNLGGTADGIWDPGTVQSPLGNEIIALFDAPYDPTGNQIEYKGNSAGWADILKAYTLNDPNATQTQIDIAASQWFNTLYAVGLKKQSASSSFQANDKLIIPVDLYPYTDSDIYTFETTFKGELTSDQQRDLFNKVNVFPNPLFGFNPATSYTNSNPDDPFVTFSNLPPQGITIKIYTLSGTLIRTLSDEDKSDPSSNFLRWDLENEDELRAASGLYLAIVSSTEFGDKILKFSIIMPQKQIQRY